MALDTKQKRGSVIGLSSPWRPWLAVADGTLSAADRLSIIYHSSAVSPEAPTPPAPAPAPRTGAGRAKKQRRRVVEIDGQDFYVDSDSAAAALLDSLRSQAAERAQLAVQRAAAAPKREPRKVLADARKLLEVPQITVPDELQPLATRTLEEIQEMYRAAMMSVEIAALLAKRQRDEEDDEDVLLLLI